MSTPNSAIELFQETYDISAVPGLWGRFNRVRKALLSSLLSEETAGVTRQASKFSWSGVDKGIHDYKGSLEGVVDGITLRAKFKGDVVDAQHYFGEREDGKFYVEFRRETNISLECYFISRDGMEGLVQLEIGRGKLEFEAYYLSCLDKNLRLEQVIGPDRQVYEAEDLERNLSNYTLIPGTHGRIPSTRQKILS